MSGSGFEIAVGAYAERLSGQPLAHRTKREYERWARSFAAWAINAPEAEEWGGDPLVDPLARDRAARDFKRWLEVERRLAPSSVNLALASLDSFFSMLGLGQPRVRRANVKPTAPRVLDGAGQRLLLRAAERAAARDRALVGVMLFAALQISEAVALDIDDVRLRAGAGAGAGDVVVGSDAAGRSVALNAVIAAMLGEWLTERQAPEAQPALFVTRRGGRLSARAADDAVRKVTADAGLQVSAQVLRHTCLANLAAGGASVAVVSELAGHRRVESTLRYYPLLQAGGRAAPRGGEIDD